MQRSVLQGPDSELIESNDHAMLDQGCSRTLHTHPLELRALNQSEWSSVTFLQESSGALTNSGCGPLSDPFFDNLLVFDTLVVRSEISFLVLAVADES